MAKAIKKKKEDRVRRVVSVRLLPRVIEFFKHYKKPNSRMARLLETYARNKMRRMEQGE